MSKQRVKYYLSIRVTDPSTISVIRAKLKNELPPHGTYGTFLDIEPYSPESASKLLSSILEIDPGIRASFKISNDLYSAYASYLMLPDGLKFMLSSPEAPGKSPEIPISDPRRKNWVTRMLETLRLTYP